MKHIRRSPAQSWLNRTVLGIALASLFSDWSHEIATSVLPAFLGSFGVAAAWLGIIEGISDGLSSFAKLGGGIQVAIEETLEDSLCAELIDPAQHGMAFGVLATVNGVGDFLSSAMVGLLWSIFGQTVAFGYTAVLFLMGSILVVRVGSVTSSP